jgi:hypothetical protein
MRFVIAAKAARFSGDTDAFATALALSCLQPHPLGEDEADDFFATSILTLRARHLADVSSGLARQNKRQLSIRPRFHSFKGSTHAEAPALVAGRFPAA